MDAVTAAASGGELSKLLELVSAGGNIALVLCLYYIIQWTKQSAAQTTQIALLVNAVNLLVAKLGYEISADGKVTPMRRDSGKARIGMLAGIALAALSTVALAATVNFNWTNATKNTDGTTIPASGPGSLTQTIVTYGNCNAAKDGIATVVGTVTATAPATSSASPDLPPGAWCAFAQHVNTYGETSDPSNVAFKVIAAPKPNPPANFSLG